MDKTTRETMFSSKDLEWGTPQHFFHRLEDKFGTFTLDPCSNASNYKVRNHFTEEDDGLAQDWGISTEEASETLEAWYRDRPEVKEWQEKTRQVYE